MEPEQHTVLVVDDDPDILRLVVTILRRLHLTVFPASGAAEALQVFQSLPAPPDLLLTDVVMPGIDGPALAKEILVRAPEVKVLFMSGFDNRTIRESPTIPIIPKPFTFDHLGAKVMEVLRAGTPEMRIRA